MTKSNSVVVRLKPDVVSLCEKFRLKRILSCKSLLETLSDSDDDKFLFDTTSHDFEFYQNASYNDLLDRMLYYCERELNL